jgi:hypothetical protein
MAILVKKIKVKKGQYSILLSNQLKGGSSYKSRKLVSGMNCVYRNVKGDKAYRVALYTEDGWKGVGEFSNLGTAAYVANVAILSAESSLLDFDLNNVEEKDSNELIEWRRNPENKKLEDIARAKYDDLMKKENEERKRREEEDLRNLNSMTLKELLICIAKRKSLGEDWKTARKVYDSKKHGT